ncbi:MAG: glycoside hydrolase family 95 protein [Clostridia bacterium]|nr:glycoside hydrolase family 95 protein [Clostridia bacterium]
MKKILINKYPATRWNDTTPLGNGVLGASVYGAVYDERILINHEALFNWCENKEIPDISYALNEVRSLMDKGDYITAESYYTNILLEKKYQPSSGKYYPAFDIHMLFESNDAFTDYSRSLDMENGVCRVSYKDGGYDCLREVFASQDNGAIIVRLTSEAPQNIKLALEKHDLTDLPDEGGASEQKTYTSNDGIYSEFTTQGGLNYCGIIKILKTDGEMKFGTLKKRKIDMSGDASFNGFLEITNATEVLLAVYACDTIQGQDKMLELVNELSSDYDELYLKHSKRFSELFNRTTLSLSSGENRSTEELLLDSYNGVVDARLIEKMADFGRYLLISSSINCSFPANLQGIWNGEYSPAWACTYFNNENIQMAYWQACRGSLAESLLPLFNLYDKFKDDYRENARNLYGCRGLLLPLFMDNGCGKKKNLQPHVLYWTGSSAWISAIYYEYYLYTRDVEFLRNRAYPFMKECALFYEDFYVYDENGKLKSYPSDSPENRPNGKFEGGGEISVCINPTMDFALLKELLTNLIDSATSLDVDSDKVEEWKKMLLSIPEYEINEDGAIKEWLHSDFLDNYHHRHQSHIYPLFPSYEIGKNEKEMFEAMRVAVEKRLVIGLKEQTGWSLAHMANIYARLKDGRGVKKCIDLLLRFCTGENLFTYHNDWRNMGVTLKYMHAGKAPFQIDANMGFTSAIYEMLLYAAPNGKFDLLPALPKELASGEVKGLKTQSGVDVSIKWTKDTAIATLKAERDTEFYVSYNESGYQKISLSKGESTVVEYVR